MEEMLTVAEFLARYKISRTEFYRQVNAGRIPIRKLGYATRVTRDDAEAWANSLPVRRGMLTIR